MKATIKRELDAIETAAREAFAPKQIRRTFVKSEGVIREDRQIITQAEFDAIDADPRFDAFLIRIEIVRPEHEPAS